MQVGRRFGNATRWVCLHKSRNYLQVTCWQAQAVTKIAHQQILMPQSSLPPKVFCRCTRFGVYWTQGRISAKFRNFGELEQTAENMTVKPMTHLRNGISTRWEFDQQLEWRTQHEWFQTLQLLICVRRCWCNSSLAFLESFLTLAGLIVMSCIEHNVRTSFQMSVHIEGL